MLERCTLQTREKRKRALAVFEHKAYVGEVHLAPDLQHSCRDVDVDAVLPMTFPPTHTLTHTYRKKKDWEGDQPGVEPRSITAKRQAQHVLTGPPCREPTVRAAAENELFPRSQRRRKQGTDRPKRVHTVDKKSGVVVED